MITDTYEITRDDDAFARIESAKVLGLLLNYGEAVVERRLLVSNSRTTHNSDTITIGFLGAGNFSTGVLMPALQGNKDFHLQSLYSATPHKARAVADQYRFNGIAESESGLLSDSSLDAVMIATPHNLHAAQVMQALNNAKHVFVEKPLCLTAGELDNIRTAYQLSGTTLMVGFNRRYSTCANKIKNHLSTRVNPVMFTYTINAGYIPKQNWIQDDNIGGGRILGEVCHFIDLMTNLLGERVATVRTDSIKGSRGQYLSDDNIVIHLTMTNGSTGVVVYTAMGDKSFPKETLQIYSDGQVLSMLDFRELTLFANGKMRTLYRGAMNKGFDAELAEFSRMIKSGQTSEEAESYFHSTEATIGALYSLQTGDSVALN